MCVGRGWGGGVSGPLAQRRYFCLAAPRESEEPGSGVVVCLLGLEALRADHGGDESPHVEDEADPAGGHLEPEHRPAAVQQLLDLVVGVAVKRKHAMRAMTRGAVHH